MKILKELIRDVLYISKITKVKNKKLTLFLVIVISQTTAFADVALIVLFSSIFTDSYSDGIVGLFINFILEYKFLMPLLVVGRFYFTYQQTMLMKRLEFDVKASISVYMLNEVFEKRNFSVADAYFYIGTLSGHIAFFYSSLVGFANSILQTLAYVAFLTYSDAQAFYVFLFGILVLFYPLKYLIKKARLLMHEIYEYSQTSNLEVQRIVDNMFLIKILKKEEVELENFNNTLKKLYKSSYDNIKISSLNGYLPSFITTFILSILLGIPRFVTSLTLDFVGVVLRLFQALGAVSNSVNKIINSHVHLSKLYEILTGRNRLFKENFIVDNELDEAIFFEDISFKYFNSDILIFENISLRIKKNSHTVLTGANGSGKSTLLGLIAGVYYSNKGKVHTYSDKFGYIGAYPLIFSDTLKANILYGNENNISDEKILESLREFKIFKEESNYKLDKVIDNKSLSSGQMQKIAFIRALLADVEILLLDESTANLDDETRNFIFEILKQKDVTIINSTHDPEQFLSIDSHVNIDIVGEKRSISTIY